MVVFFRIWIQLSVWFLWSRMEGRNDKRGGWGICLKFMHLEVLAASVKLSDLYAKSVKSRIIFWIFLWNACYMMRLRSIICKSFGFLLQKLVVKAVSLAIARDGASGGVVRTVTVSFFCHLFVKWTPLTLMISAWEPLANPSFDSTLPWNCNN